MSNPAAIIREHLVRVLDWEDAHVGFDKAVAGVPPHARGVRPPGFDHSVYTWLMLAILCGIWAEQRHPVSNYA